MTNIAFLMILYSDQSQFHKHMWDVDVTSMQILYHQHTTFFYDIILNPELMWKGLKSTFQLLLALLQHHFISASHPQVSHFYSTHLSLSSGHAHGLYCNHRLQLPLVTCTTQQLEPFHCYFPPTSLPLPLQIMLIAIQHLSISPCSSMLALAHLSRQMNCKIIGATEQRDQEKQRNIMPSSITIK